MSKITRQFTPSPWHDALLHDYKRLAVMEPLAAARYCRAKYGLAADWEVRVIVAWCSDRKRTWRCPVL